MVTSYISNFDSVFAHTQYTTNYITMALTPIPFVLLYLPTINNITHEEQIFTGMMFKEVIKYIGLCAFGAKMGITDTDRFVFCLVHIVFKHI